MSEMVERVARAIRADITGDSDNHFPIVGDGQDGVGSYIEIARAAIEAMREHLIQCTTRDNEQSYYAAIDEIEDALGKDRT